MRKWTNLAMVFSLGSHLPSWSCQLFLVNWCLRLGGGAYSGPCPLVTKSASISKPTRLEISNIHLIPNHNKSGGFHLFYFLSFNFLKVYVSKMLPINETPPNPDMRWDRNFSERKAGAIIKSNIASTCCFHLFEECSSIIQTTKYIYFWRELRKLPLYTEF